MSGDSQTMLRGLLVTTFSTDNALRNNAEKTLAGLEVQQGFTLEVLRMLSNLSKSTVPEDMSVRLAAAAVFKNAVRRRWVPADDADDITPIPNSDRDIIKVNLVDLMCSAPKDVQKQLGEAVSMIAKHDFPAKWENLIAHLVSKLQGCQDLYVINGVMSTASSLFKRYRYAMRTDSLFRELKFCLEGFQVPLLEMYKSMASYAKSGQLNGDKRQLELVMETIYQMTRIFWSLNNQDLPEYFEDNMAPWMEEFAALLVYNNPVLVDEDEEEEPGVLERVQAAIIENLNLYATKYEEEFASHLPRFTELIWKMLVEVKAQPKYDALATQGIKFLTAVAGKQMYSHLFTDAVLQDIIHSIVVKNLMVTERDEELFEDNPFDYIRKDMEGSDQETRRRCAMELVRALLKLFSVKTSQLCSSYVEELMKQYQVTNNWKLKDAALHLILSVSVLTSSNTMGASELNPNVQILELFNVHVLPELADTQTMRARPMVKADVIKLVCIFRNHLDVSQLSTVILPLLIRYLTSKGVVIQTYAALCIEKFLALKMKDSNNKSVSKLTKEHVNPYLQELFGNLFTVLESEPANAENDYIMKCVMRVLLVIGGDMVSALELISNKLTSILERVCKNPINPQFNHFLFECIAVMIRSGCELSPAHGIQQETVAANCTKFEALLFPSFQAVLAQDVTEFVPYVFQLLAQLLFYRPAPGLSSAYQALFPPLLSPVLWERKGNIPALMELFQVYIRKGMSDIVAGGFLVGLLGIFQKLLSARSTEQHAFTMLNLLLRHTPLTSLEQYLPTILQLVLNRMMANKAARFYKLCVHMFCVFTINYGGQTLFRLMEAIQPNLLINVLEQVYAPTLEYICNSIDLVTGCEICVGTVKLLTCEVSAVRDNASLWGSLFKSFVVVCAKTGTLNGSCKGVDEEPAGLLITGLMNADGEVMGGGQDFDNAYSKLQYANIPQPAHLIINDVVSGGEDIFGHSTLLCAQALGGVMQQNPGKYSGTIKAISSAPEFANVAQAVFVRNNVNIV